VTVIGMVAGEPSGDTLGAHLIHALRARHPDARFVGIGGPKMISAGLESWHPQEKLAVRGLVEVLKHLRELFAIRRDLVRRLVAARPALFVGIDSPDFNLGLEKRLKRRGIPTAHYVSPTIWAWRPGRLAKIRRSASHMLCLFPFEAPLYAGSGVEATFVGHPLAEEIEAGRTKADAREALRLHPERRVVTLLPGSRASELEMMAGPFIEAAKLVHAVRPETAFLVPFVTRETRRQFEQALYDAGAQDLPVTLLFGHAHDAMAAADVVLVASGTATLETALVGRPMVVAYRLAPTTYRLARHLVRIPWVGLPNILAREFVVPEFLQDEATPANLAQAVLNLMEDTELAARLGACFAEMHATLRRDSATLAAEALAAYLPALPAKIRDHAPASGHAG
jgi:lipid-A-disaccharide synthase